MTRPEWSDGEPTNLTAAVMDALQWLRLMQQFMEREKPAGSSVIVVVWQDAQKRLARAVDALEAHAPKEDKHEQ